MLLIINIIYKWEILCQWLCLKKWCKKIKKNKNLNIMWYGGNGNKLEIEN